MCIVSTPKVGATNVPAPTDVSADGLTTGAAGISGNNVGVLGRLALSGGQRSARAASNASAGSADGSTTASTPGGTLGLPSNYLGAPVLGGLKPKL